MILDETVEHYNVRECDNRIRVAVTKTPHNTYVSYDCLVGSRWEYVDGSAVGLGSRDPMPLARSMYEKAPQKFGRNPSRMRAVAP